MDNIENDIMSANKIIDSLVARRRKLESILNHHRTHRSARFTPLLNVTNTDSVPEDSNANRSTPLPNVTSTDSVPEDSNANRSTTLSGGLQADKKIQILSNVPVEFPFPGLKKRRIVPECTLSQIEPSTSFDNDTTASVNHETLRAQDSSSDNIDGGKVKRKQTISKSYLDFISNEELNEDFSGGSSDEWSQKETEISSEDETMQKNKKRRKKSNTKGKEEEERQLSKKRNKKENKSKLRKASKDSGSAYATRTGKPIEEKVLKENPCVPGKCARGCFNVSKERRQSIFSHYWSLDPQRRKDWLLRCAQPVPIKRRKCNDFDSRRNNTYEYFINNGEDHTKVCQKFILNTLDIKQKFLLYTVTNSLEGMAKKDNRSSNASIKNNPQAIEDAKQFIEDLPAVPSHYCRKSSKRLYLPQDLKNVSNVYKIYRKKCNDDNKIAVTEVKFREIFKNDFSISFHTPKKDKCTICVKAENCDNLTENEKLNLQKHLEEKKATYKRFSAHQKLKNNHLLGGQIITCSFDLQKVLNTPHGDSMLLYYARKYAVFDLTFYESGTQKVYCYVWGECDGKRGGQEIATCLYKYLQEVDKRGFRRVLLYCDACAGQNKNRIILSAIRHFLKESTNIEVVQINYLLPGHSYMPVDSVHAVIEREVKKIIVWSPSEWPTLISSARKSPFPYNVTCLEYSDFFDWQEIVDKTFTKELTKSLKIQEKRVATLKKTDLNIIEIKRSMTDEAEVSKLSLIENRQGKRKGKGKGKKTNTTRDSEVPIEETATTSNTDAKLNQLYSKRLTISLQKYKDLMRLCENGTIPRRFHNEYKSLPYLSETKDTLPETDEDDD